MQRLFLACVDLVRAISPTHANDISAQVASVISRDIFQKTSDRTDAIKHE